jgi:hypothetical protein
MSLSGYFADLVTGEPFGTSDASTAAGQAADVAEVQINQQKLADGTYTPEQAAQIATDYSTNADGNVGSAAVSGLTSSVTDQLSGVPGSGPIGDIVSAVKTTLTAGTTIVIVVVLGVFGFLVWSAWKKK